LNFCLLYEPFYVGKGSGRRYKVHMNHSKFDTNKENFNKIDEIKQHNIEPHIMLFNFTMDEKQAFIRESECIVSIGCTYDKSGPLSNKIATYQQICSEELRKSYGSPKEKHPLWGKSHTPEARKKISENHIDCSGANNVKAKRHIFIDPHGTEYIVHGRLLDFIKEQKFPTWHTQIHLYDYMNKGKITIEMLMTNNKHIRNKTKNLLGWEIKSS
jgi:hypothetical protein